MVTFTINIPPMLAYIPYMDPMGVYIDIYTQHYRTYRESNLSLENVQRYSYLPLKSSVKHRSTVTPWFFLFAKAAKMCLPPEPPKHQILGAVGIYLGYFKGFTP